MKQLPLVSILFFTIICLASCSNDEEACGPISYEDNGFVGTWNLSYTETVFAADTIKFMLPGRKGTATFNADRTGVMSESAKDFDIYYEYFKDANKWGLVRNDATILSFDFGRRTGSLYNIKTLTADTIKLEYYFHQFGTFGTPSAQGVLNQYTFYK